MITRSLPAITQLLPPTPPVPPVERVTGGASPEPERVFRIRLRGEEIPRPCQWDSSDLTMFADFDREVGGFENLDLRRLWHVLALLWVTNSARHEMPLREFARRIPTGPDVIRKLCNGARHIWQTITL